MIEWVIDPGWGWIKTRAEGPSPWEETALGDSLLLYGAERIYDQNSIQTCLSKMGDLLSHTLGVPGKKWLQVGLDPGTH